VGQLALNAGIFEDISICKKSQDSTKKELSKTQNQERKQATFLKMPPAKHGSTTPTTKTLSGNNSVRTQALKSRTTINASTNNKIANPQK